MQKALERQQLTSMLNNGIQGNDNVEMSLGNGEGPLTESTPQPISNQQAIELSQQNPNSNNGQTMNTATYGVSVTEEDVALGLGEHNVFMADAEGDIANPHLNQISPYGHGTDGVSSAEAYDILFGSGGMLDETGVQSTFNLDVNEDVESSLANSGIDGGVGDLSDDFSNNIDDDLSQPDEINGSTGGYQLTSDEGNGDTKPDTDSGGGITDALDGLLDDFSNKMEDDFNQPQQDNTSAENGGNVNTGGEGAPEDVETGPEDQSEEGSEEPDSEDFYGGAPGGNEHEGVLPENEENSETGSEAPQEEQEGDSEQTDATGNGITPEMYELLFGGADETVDNGETAVEHDDVMSYQVDADELDVNEQVEGMQTLSDLYPNRVFSDKLTGGTIEKDWGKHFGLKGVYLEMAKEELAQVVNNGDVTKLQNYGINPEDNLTREQMLYKIYVHIGRAYQDVQAGAMHGVNPVSQPNSTPNTQPTGSQQNNNGSTQQQVDYTDVLPDNNQINVGSGIGSYSPNIYGAPDNSNGSGSSSSSSGQSAKALKKATDAVNKLTEENLKELYSKYKKQFQKSFSLGNYTKKQKEIKKLYIAVVEELKQIVAKAKGKLTPDDKRKLVKEVTRKLTDLMKGNKITYALYIEKNGKVVRNDYTADKWTHFKDGLFMGPLKSVCVTHDAVIAYVLGASKVGSAGGGYTCWEPNDKNFKNYIYDKTYFDKDKYDKLTPAQKKKLINSYNEHRPQYNGFKWPGVTALAHNTDVLKKIDGMNKTKIVDLMQKYKAAKAGNNQSEMKKYLKELKKLEGTVFMLSRTTINNRPYQTYSHTGIIVGFNETTGSFIISDSTRVSKNGKIIRTGTDFSYYYSTNINNTSVFDIYQYNY